MAKGRASVDTSDGLQGRYRVRFEWGVDGVRHLAPGSDVLIVVDVLSFTTAIDVACSRDAAVFPYRVQDDTAKSFAESRGALLAGPRGTEPSLSPSSLQSIPPRSRIVLPSVNGSSCSVAAREFGIPVIAGSLRNAQAVSEYVLRNVGRGVVSVVAAGERWPSGMIRFAVEDLIGAGAILSAFSQRLLSPEARMAVGAFEGVSSSLSHVLASSMSGQELISRGFSSDVAMAGEYNISETVPILREDAFVRAGQPDKNSSSASIED